MKNATLTVKKLTKVFSSKATTQTVLTDISCSFQRGKSYAIIGASGCGKSTLLHCIAGLDNPSSGSVDYDGIDIHRLKQKEKERLLNTTFGFVFQFHYLLQELSVIENIMIPGLIGNMSHAQANKRAQELLSTIGLEHKAGSYPGLLSGGEQQRVSIARALFNKPQFLFADEPTGNLDEASADQITELFDTLGTKERMGLILCSHDKRVYTSMQHVWRLHQGSLDMQQDTHQENE